MSRDVCFQDLGHSKKVFWFSGLSEEKNRGGWVVILYFTHDQSLLRAFLKRPFIDFTVHRLISQILWEGSYRVTHQQVERASSAVFN